MRTRFKMRSRLLAAMLLILSAKAETTAAIAQKNDPEDKSFKICSVVGGLDTTRLISSRTRNLFRAALEDVELIREYLSEAASGGMSTVKLDALTILNSTLDWEARNLTQDQTTLTAGLGFTDDDKDRRIERYVSTVNQPLIGTKETDLAFIDPVANIFPWIVDRKSVETGWHKPHQNGKSTETLEKQNSFHHLYIAAWIGTFGEAWMYYPPLTAIAPHPLSFGDVLGNTYDSHEEEFVKPNLPENNPDRRAIFTKPYPDTAVPGLSLITAQAPVYFTGEFGGYQYNNTYVASTGVDISISDISSLLQNLEGTLSEGSLAFLVTVEDFSMVAISQSTVNKIYPARTGFEESRVTYSVSDGSISADRRNQTYLVSDTIFQSPTDLENANWQHVADRVKDLLPGDRNFTTVNLTTTGSPESEPYWFMYERWGDVADWALVVLAPKEQVDTAISVKANDTSIELQAGKVEAMKRSTTIWNHGTMDVQIQIEKLPFWLELLYAFDENNRAKVFQIAAGQSFNFTFETRALEEISGISSAIIAFTVVDDDYPDCFHEQVLTIPITVTVLREEEFNQLVGGVRAYGFALTFIIAFTAIGCSVWTALNGNHRVVRASQPVFLQMMCCGILFMGLSIIPMSLDDAILDERGCDVACMSVPWLLASGFSVTFSALFSKVWRINQIVGAQHETRRVRVSVRHVMVPFFVLFSLNLTLLSFWTAYDPLVWTRELVEGSNHVSTGHCSLRENSSIGIGCFVLLLLVNFVALVLALIQLYHARAISTEYSEGKYIAIAIGSMVQVFLTGLPILIIITDSPQALYFVMSTIVFVVTMSLLLLTFVPKFVLTEKERQESSGNNGSNNFMPESPVSHPAALSDNMEEANNQDATMMFQDRNGGYAEPQIIGDLPDEERSHSSGFLPFLSELSISLGTISENNPDDGHSHHTRSALSPNEYESDRNAKFPRRTQSALDPEDVLPYAPSLSPSTNAKFPQRSDSTMQNSSFSVSENDSLQSTNAKFPVRAESTVENSDVPLSVTADNSSEKPNSFPMERVPSRRTSNFFQNVTLPRRVPSCAEN